MPPLPWIFLWLLTASVGLAGAWIGWRSRARAWRKTKGLRIPPGTASWPLVGETVSFLWVGTVDALLEFVGARVKRYGKIYTTHLFGGPTIVSTDIELNQFIFQNDEKLFEHVWLDFFTKIFGTALPGMYPKENHQPLRNLFHEFLSMSRLRSHYMPKFEQYTVRILDSWEEGATISAHEEASKLSFYMIVNSTLGVNPGDADMEELREGFDSLLKGFVSFPLNLPGTTFRKALKARAGVLRILERLMEDKIEKRKMGRGVEGDFDLLDILLERSSLSLEEVADQMIGIIFAGLSTISFGFSLSIYYLGNCKKAVQQLREEHLEIYHKKKERKIPQLMWEDYKQMEFTQCVIKETLRMGNISSYFLKKAKSNVQFKGFDIPQGWIVLPIIAATQMDDNIYREPKQFNPWRWKETSTEKKMLSNYMPFIIGPYQCVGMELAKLEMAIFIHHLVLKYDWQQAELDNPQLYFGFHKFEKGLPIKVRAISSPT